MDDLLLRGVTNVTNHRILLHYAIEETRGSALPVLAMGIDSETTALLRAVLEAEGRVLVSMEEDILAAAAIQRTAGRRHEVVCSAWDTAPIEARGPWSVAVMNHAPGERRKDDALRLLGRCEVIVLHDTEPNADRGYQFSTIWGRFRSRVDVKTGGAWASAVSETRDLSSWRGRRVDGYVVTLAEEDRIEDEVSVQVERMFEARAERAW